MLVGKWNRSVILTYAGMVISVLGIFLALTTDKINYAFCCLMIAGICDLFDGMVARRCKRTDEEKLFGIELDSIVDTVSFVALPVCIFIASGLTAIWDVLIFILFALAGVARLAYFNIDTADSNKAVKYYIGLPVTYTALIFPLIYLLSFPLEAGIFMWIYRAVIVLVSVFEMLKINVPKPRGIWYGIFGVLAIVLVTVYLSFLG
ncbi:MAG: CDP-alcohol phosphatidyltransferase family protein [Saccharofermentans sp.]|nr:CDP-alcohol phosphatidyltransferase family protein [Saccharofermentans sp.]